MVKHTLSKFRLNRPTQRYAWSTLSAFFQPSAKSQVNVDCVDCVGVYTRENSGGQDSEINLFFIFSKSKRC